MIFRHALVHRFIPIAQTSEWYSYFDNEVLVSCRIQNIRYIYIGRNAVGRGRQQHPCDIFAGLAEILIVHLKMISLCPQADQIAEAVCCEERTFFRRIIYLRAVRVKQGITVTKQCSAHFLPFAKFLVKLVIRQCSQILIILSGARKGPAFLFQSRCNLLYRLAVRLIIICGLVHLITKNAADTCHRDHAACALV